MSAKHTPGPWRAVGSKLGDDFGIVDSTGKNVIAECFSDIRSQGEHAMQEAAANARLIAASPKLLAALIAIYDRHNASTMAQARAAIAEATGEQS